MMRLWGKAGKAGKEQRPTPVAGSAQGPTSPGNRIPAPGWRFGANPQSFALAHSLGVATSLVSPMVRGRFRPGDSGSADARGGTPDFGALQGFRGLVGVPQRLNLGMQAGPSAQPGFPSTGQGGIVTQLAAMRRPGRQIIGRM